jgi:two-component system OmpR family response regulator
MRPARCAARLEKQRYVRRRFTVVNRPEPPTTAKTILICEDDSNLRTLVRLALGQGYNFLEAPDGYVAMELLRRTEPDLIVLDLMLPGRSGLELLGEIRRVAGHERTPVIVISAWAHSDTAAVAAGANRFVAKPFDPRDLHDAVVDLLEGNGSQR